jgi:hypothetical protein
MCDPVIGIEGKHAPATFGLGKNRSMGSSLSPAMYTLSPFLKLLATIPSPIFTEKYTSLIGPRISSTLPMTDLF